MSDCVEKNEIMDGAKASNSSNFYTCVGKFAAVGFTFVPKNVELRSHD